MSDGFSPRHLRKPPSGRVLDQEDKDYRALAVYYRTQDEGAVKKALGLRNRAEARVRINRARERLQDNRERFLEDVRGMHNAALMQMFGDLWTAWEEGNRDPVAWLKVMERHAKLHGLDAQPDREADTGPPVFLTDLATAMRMAGAKGETIDGTWTDEEGPKALPGPAD